MQFREPNERFQKTILRLKDIEHQKFYLSLRNTSFNIGNRSRTSNRIDIFISLE